MEPSPTLGHSKMTDLPTPLYLESQNVVPLPLFFVTSFRTSKDQKAPEILKRSPKYTFFKDPLNLNFKSRGQVPRPVNALDLLGGIHKLRHSDLT